MAPNRTVYLYRWGNNAIRAARKGQRCRIVAAGRMNTVLLEFEDGLRMTSSRRALTPVSDTPIYRGVSGEVS